MNNTIYLMRFHHTDPIDQTKNRLKKLFKTAGFDKIVEANDITAVKVHFGEPGNTTHLSPHYIEPIVRMIKSCGAKPFVTDTNVLYKSRRDNAIDHLSVATEHGFTSEKLGAPIIIADGIMGRNETEIEIDAPLNKTISLATELVSANSAIVISHATGHLATGLAATIKNLGMGMSSRKGKLTQHSVSKPIISERKCTACGVCAKWCPVDAIIVGDEFAVINEDICIGCGECLAVCRFNAVKFKWDSSSELLQKQVAEHALGIVKQKNGKMAYMTFLINMTKDCDCLAHKPEIVLDDIGVLAGTDPVAIDQAVYDLTKQRADKTLSELSYPSLDANVQLKYGEKIGLGTRKYQLVETEF
ncbi:MAG: DUF362 domain-containing protein [Candidatus Marinimicrobia bacterium]|nr:DUF362 domain-containing protein [Candidatus Neomarinimicrobiota bacterium]